MTNGRRPGLEAILQHSALFVTGTDTDAGKTVVGVALGRAWRAAGDEVCAVKALASGGERQPDGEVLYSDAQALGTTTSELGAMLLSEHGGVPRHAPLLGLTLPIAPWTAALLDHREIDTDALVAKLATLKERCAAARVKFLVEGAGGALVPLGPRMTMAGLAAALEMPAVIVGRSALGTINHTLLTLEALQRRGVAIAGIVLSRTQQTGHYSVAEKASFRELDAWLPPEIPVVLAGHAEPGATAPIIDLPRIPLADY